MTERLAWRKSTLSSDEAECVEVAPLPGAVAVRDSTDPDGPRLAIDRDGWRAFVAGVLASA